MFKSLSQLLEEAQQKDTKKMAIAGADDSVVLKAIKMAQDNNLIQAVLIGDERRIKDIASEIDFDLTSSEVINETEPRQMARKAVDLAVQKKADMVMKGMISTSIILKAILESDSIIGNSLLSHVAALRPLNYEKLILITDVAMNIAPTLIQKAMITQNAIKVARALECEKPKVAILSAVEMVNEKMPSTVDAAILSKMADRGQIKGAIVDGPLALDNAISLESAQHKGIKSEVAGKADILVVPNIETGNALYKSIVFFCKSAMAGVIVGAKFPVVLTSRADSEESKLYSVALGVLLS